MTVFESKLRKELSRRFDCSCLFVSKTDTKILSKMVAEAVETEWNGVQSQSRKYYLYTMPALHTDFRVLQQQEYEPVCECGYANRYTESYTRAAGIIPAMPEKGVVVFVELWDDGKIPYDINAHYCVC